MSEFEDRILALEKLHENFRIVAGSNVTVEGSLGKGHAICSTCPPEAVVTEGGLPIGGGGGPPGTGACCYTDGSCTVQTSTACTTAGGMYQGNGTVCAPNPCPQPTGACCVGDECSITTAADCLGNYLGDDTICVSNLCCCTYPPEGSYCCVDNTNSEYHCCFDIVPCCRDTIGFATTAGHCMCMPHADADGHLIPCDAWNPPGNWFPC
jgi:hypothetical protein